MKQSRNEMRLGLTYSSTQLFSYRAVLLGRSSARGWELCELPGEKPGESLLGAFKRNTPKRFLKKKVIVGKMILVANIENNKIPPPHTPK